MIARLEDGTVLARRIMSADSFARRLRGLMFSGSFPPEYDGLVLSPCNAVHTMFMRFTIDVLFLDRHLHVLHVVTDMPPWRLSPVIKKAKLVLELRGGTVKQRGISVGDRLDFIIEGKAG